MRLPRMTTRRWMIAVVIVGLVMGGVVVVVRLKRRREYFLIQTHHFEFMESVNRYMRDNALKFSTFSDIEMEGERTPQRARLEAEMADLRRDAEMLARRADHYAELVRKYRHAARYPWLPVEPDPPEPE